MAATWPVPGGLWRATGMTDADFGKPISPIANSFTQFVPGHVHLQDLGQLWRARSRRWAVSPGIQHHRVDDGIAMGMEACSIPCRRAT